MITPFRFWCQKVIPLVYDNSLSYYELLCKVVDYLNNVINDLNSTIQRQDELEVLFNQLKDYVDNYFKNLDVQKEINNKLDEMVMNGTFADVIMPIVVQYSTPHFVDNTSQMTNKNYIYVLNTTGNVWAWNGSEFIDTSIPYLGGVFEFMRNYGTLPNNSDLNDIITNSYYVLNNTFNYQNMPPELGTGIPAFLETIFSNSSTSIQNFYEFSTGIRWYRRKSLNKWGNWIKAAYTDPLLSLDYQLEISADTALSKYNGLAANVERNTFAWIAKGWFTDLPNDDNLTQTSSAWLTTYGTGGSRKKASSVGTQTLMFPAEGRAFYRRVASYNNNQATWGEWKETVLIDKQVDLIQISIYQNTAETVYGNLAANLPRNTYSWVSSLWWTDLPETLNGSFWIYTYAVGGSRDKVSSYGSQVILNPITGKMYTRSWNQHGNKFYDWVEITWEDPNTALEFLMNMNESVAETKYDKLLTNLPKNTFCWVGNSWFTDKPESFNNSYWIQTYGSGGSRNKTTYYGAQIAFSPYINTTFTRYMTNYNPDTGIATWSNWKQQTYVDPLLSIDCVPSLNEKIVKERYDGLAVNMPRNTFAWISRAWFTDVPQIFPSSGAWLVTLGAGGSRSKAASFGTQLILSPQNGVTGYSRIVTGGTAQEPTWSDWSPLNGKPYSSAPKYVAFGDSLMWGSKWVEQEGGTAKIERTAIINRMPTRIAEAVGSLYNFENQAVGGMAYINQPGVTTQTMEEKIKSVDLTDAKLVTLGGGRNDGSNPLGTSDSMANDGTICGAIKSILDYLTTTYPFLQIVMTQVTPSTNNAADIFTGKTRGGWSLNDYETEVSTLCAAYGVPFVGWKDCTYIYHWVQFTGAGGNYAHPNNDESYLQMGNYIAGKVSQYYKG